MFKQLTLALGMSLAAAVPVAAQNDLWGNVGDWEIAIDPTIDNGCYAFASWNGGTTLRIGRNPQSQNFYFLIGNEAWSSLRPDASYDIQIELGDFPSWDVSATGFQFNQGETVYLHAQSSQMDFIEEFQSALNMRLSYDGTEIDNLKLTGARDAWNEVERCQQEMNGHSPNNDPFNTSGGGNDPFATVGDGKKSTAKNS